MANTSDSNNIQTQLLSSSRTYPLTIFRAVVMQLPSTILFTTNSDGSKVIRVKITICYYNITLPMEESTPKVL